MGNPAIQTPPSSDLMRFPIPPSIHSKPNEPISYFPPLKLGHSRDSLPPLLFPLVPTQQIAPKGSDCTEASIGAVPNNDGTEEFPNPRDSWSYWIGGEAHLGKPHISKQIQGEDAPGTCWTGGGGGEPDAVHAELGVAKLDSEAQLVPDLMGPRSSEKHLQLTPNKFGQVNEAQLSGPDSSEGISNPQSASPVALPPAQQPERIREESPTVPLSSYRCNPHRHIFNESPYSATGILQGERSHSTQSQKAYSSVMGSHPSFHHTQPSPTSGRQMRSFLLQGSSTITDGLQIHQIKPSPYPAPGPLQKRYPVRLSPSKIPHPRAFEKHLLRNSSGRLPSNKHNQHFKIGQPAMLHTNSYQPPRGSLPISKRYNNRSLRSDGSTNFSYPRAYSDPPRYKRRSSGSIHSSTGYGDRFVALGSGVNGSYRGHGYGATGGIARAMSGGHRESVLRDFQDHLRIQNDVAPDVELTQFDEGTHIVSRRSSIQSQSPHRSNFFIPDRPTASPVRNSSCQSTNELCDGMSPLDHDLPSSSWKNSRMSLDGEVQDTQHVDSNIAFPPGGAEEETCLENTEFTTTVDAASRPYTPDQFIVEVGLTRHNSNAARDLSKQTVGSPGSIRNTRRRSVGSAGSIYAIPRSSSNHGQNVLRKPKPLYSIWPNLAPTRMGPWNAGDGSIPPYRASTAPVGNRGTVDIFRERKRLAKELRDAIDRPHTAKTRAGPTRGVGRDNSPSAGIRPGVYQPDASESRLNSLAREGMAKYEATNREIRLHIAAQSEFERVGRIDTSPSSTDNQGSTNFKKHKNIENPGAMKSGNISQPDTTRVITGTIEEPQATNLDAVEAKSATPTSGYIYLSTVYHEGQRMVEKFWERGIGGRFANLGSKQNNTARNLRYGTAGKKVKVYMRGARSESLTVFEKIGKNFGIRKGKESTPVEPAGADPNENDPFGIGVCGAVDITGGREQTGDLSGLNERGFNSEPPRSVWKDFEEGELVDPVKFKLEEENSKKYWSSRKEVEVKTTWWGKVRNLVKK